MSLPPALLCAHCHAPLLPSADACPRCGQAARPACPSCGQGNRPGARYCRACGSSLAGPSGAASAPPLFSARAAPGAILGAGVHLGEKAAPSPAGAAVAMAVSIGLAVIAQSAVLRTHWAVPAVPLFVLAAAIGGWVALRRLPGDDAPAGMLGPPARGRAGPAVLGLAVAANAGALLLFARGAGLNLAWQLFDVSLVLCAVAFWLLDGRPRPAVNWPAEAPWLAALAAITAAGGALRFVDLGSVPFGLWFDEAYSGLQVQKILGDPTFRPVFVGGIAQEPSLLWYLMALAFKLLGAGQLALRVPTALGGTLGIPAMYLLGRELFGRRTGLIAAGLLSTLVWHLTFSRLGFNSVWSVTVDALALFFLFRAVHRGSWTAAALAGLTFGLGLHFYYTSRLMIVVAGLAALLAWLKASGSERKTVGGVVLAAAAAGLIAGSPIAEFAALHPAEFNSRLQQASVLNEVRAQHSYAPLFGNVRGHLLMFNLAGDRNARHNLPGQPELNFLLGGLFVLGLGICLARWRQPRHLLLPMWSLLMLAGGVFSVSFEAPQSLRTIDEVNVAALLCALPLALLWEACASAPKAEPMAARPPAAGVGATPVRPADDWAGVSATPVRPADDRAGVSATPVRPADDRAGVRRALDAPPVPPPPVGKGAWLLLPAWALAAVWLTDPVYRHFTTAVPAGNDSPQFLWNLWWFKHALLDLHQSPLYTTYLFAPQRMNLAFHTPLLLTGLLTLPVQLAFGLFAAVNVMLLGSLVAGAATAYLLVKQETGSAAGAFVGSLVFTYAPYKFMHLNAGHMHVLLGWGVPLFAFFALRWLRIGRIRYAALAGVCLGCVGLVDLNQLSLTFVLGALLVLGFTAIHARAWLRAGTMVRHLAQEAAGIAAIGAASIALLLPVLLALLDGLAHGWDTSNPIEAPNGWAPDLVSYLVPLPIHPWWGKVGLAAAQRFHYLDPPRIVFIGYTALGLSLLALAVRRGTNAGKWWLVALGFWLLSLGPTLHAAGRTTFGVGGVTFAVPLPFALFHRLPYVGGLSIPGYASIGLFVALAVLSGHGAAWLARRTAGTLVGPGLGLLILVEGLTTPLPLFGPHVDPVYQRLRAEPGQRAVLMTPVGWVAELGGLGTFDIADMYFATVAEKPIVGGEVSRVPGRVLDFYRSQPALFTLYFPDRQATPQSQDARLVTEALQRSNIGYIVVRRWAYFDRQAQYLAGTLRYPVIYQDGELTAFRVPW